MTKATKSNLDFRNPLKKVKDTPHKQLTHRLTLSARKGDKAGDPKYGEVDRVRTATEVEAELEAVNRGLDNFKKDLDDPRRFSNKQDRNPDPDWKRVQIQALERKRDKLVNELSSIHSSREHDSKPMSGQLTYFMKAAAQLQRQIDTLPELWGDERSTLAVARARRHLEDLQERIRVLMQTHQPYGDSEVDDEVAERAAKLYAEWQRSKEA